MALNAIQADHFRFLERHTPQIYIKTWSNAARTIDLGVVTKHGLTKYKHVTTADRSVKGETFRVPDVPTAVMVEVMATPVRRGECYASVFLGFAGVSWMHIGCGYLHDGGVLAWPPGKFESSVEGPGLLRSITGTDPAAGVEISETVPTNARWKLRGICYSLVTSTTVGTRRTGIVIDDGTNIIERMWCQDQQAENLTRSYFFASRTPPTPASVGSEFYGSLPIDCILFQGWRVRTLTADFQAGDNYGAPQLYVEEWLEE